jgi:hypothetical protein
MQEWGGWRDAKTVRIYADYRPDPQEAAWISAAFPSPIHPPNSTQQDVTSSDENGSLEPKSD